MYENNWEGSFNVKKQNAVKRIISRLCSVFSCPGHPWITAFVDSFTLVKYVYIIIIITIIIIIIIIIIISQKENVWTFRLQN